MRVKTCDKYSHPCALLTGCFIDAAYDCDWAGGIGIALTPTTDADHRELARDNPRLEDAWPAALAHTPQAEAESPRVIGPLALAARVTHHDTPRPL